MEDIPKEMAAMDKIPIYMPTEDAKVFLAFQRHYEVFSAMDAADAFSVGWGKVVLNFADNKLMTVVREEVGWKRDR